MANQSVCIDCGTEIPVGRRTSQVGRKAYVLCESCNRDREIREENVAVIRRVLKLEGRDREPAADKALAAYLYAEITLWELADLIGAPFVTIPIPALKRSDSEDGEEGIGGSRKP